MDLSLQRELARLLAALRREGRQQSGLDPRLVPPDKATAYRVARMVAEELGWEIAGWKIAAAKEEMQRALRTDSPIYGRVFAPMVKASPFTTAHAGLCSPIPEVEYQARLGVDLPPRPGLTRKKRSPKRLLRCIRESNWMISTGTLTGMLAPKPGETYVADFGPFGTVRLTFT